MLLEHRTLPDDETPLWFEPQSLPAWGTTAPDSVVELEGELDLAAIGQLNEALNGLDALSLGRVVVDCRRVSFCDSRGLEALLRHWRKIEQAGLGFAIITSPAVEFVAGLARSRLPTTSPPGVFSDAVLVRRSHLGERKLAE